MLSLGNYTLADAEDEDLAVLIAALPQLEALNLQDSFDFATDAGAAVAPVSCCNDFCMREACQFVCLPGKQHLLVAGVS